MYRMISLHKCILTISLLIFAQSITILCATVDPTPYYQRSNDGSYRYGYNAGGGFNARQSANEVVGQYAQLQPDGSIANVRYKAGVGGFRPQYGAASPAFSGAALGGSDALARQSLANGFYGTGSGPFGARSLSGGSPFGYGSLNTPRFSSDAAYGGGSPANGAFSGSGAQGGGLFGAGPFGGGSFGSGSLGGGPGGRSLGTGSEGGLQGGGGLGSGGLVGGLQGRVPFGAAGDRPLGNDGIGGISGGSNLGPGYSGGPNGNRLGPGSFANRSPIGGSLGAGTIGGRSPTDGTFAPGSSTGNTIGPQGSNAIGGLPQQRFGSGTPGSAYGGFPRYAPTSAFGSPFGYPQRVPLAFVYTTPRSLTTPATNRNSGPFGDGSYPSRPALGNSRGVIPETNAFRNDVGNHDQDYATTPNAGYRPTGGSLATPNGLPNQIASSTTIRPPATGSQSSPRNDGTYNFAYRTPDSTRQESADGNGNVQGSYSFRNANGDHDLSFVAGPSTGFQPTGGSLAVPNGIGQRSPSVSSPTVSPTATTFATTTVRPDGPTFQVDPVTAQIGQGGNGYGARSGPDFGTTESGIVYTTNPAQIFSTTVRSLPAIGQNSNSFQNGASIANGQGFNGDRSGNDQRFHSNGNNGFGQVGGNAVSGRRIGENQGPDGSYGFQQTNPGYGSFGAGGADGNLGSSSNSGPFNRGNGLGNGGLGGGFGSAGGGSLSNAYGRPGGGGSGSGSSYGTGTAHSNQGRDGSYDFSYDTGRQAHRESGDGSGRVDGRYSYLSDGRQQSLSYRVRPGTGFEVTGGNLASKTAIPK